MKLLFPSVRRRRSRALMPARALIPVALTAALTVSACGGGSHAGTPWKGTRQFGTTDSAYNVRTAVDSSGAIYVTVMTDQNEPTNMLVKLDPAGDQAWSRPLGSTVVGFPAGVDVDGAGNVYVYAVAENGLSFAIMKFDGQGNKLWSTVLDPTLGHVYDIAVDSSGNVYAGATDVNAMPSSCSVAKLDASGAVTWTKHFMVPMSALVARLASSVDGSVVVVGSAFPDTDLGGTSTDLFVTKFDANGEQLWLQTLGTDQEEVASGVATDGAGNVYVSGITGGDLDGNLRAGDTDAYVVKYDAGGSKQWTRQVGTTSTDYGSGVAVDLTGAVYLTGSTRLTIAGGRSPNGKNDLFLIKYDAAGTQQWAHQDGTAGSDDPADMARDPGGGVFVVGTTTAGLDGSIIPIRHEVFVAKYRPDGAIVGASTPVGIGSGNTP